MQRSYINFSIIYTPGERISTSTHPGFKYLRTLTKNTFRDRLNDKKQQLLNSGFLGVKGIFICDGDCEMLRKTSTGWNERSAGDVIRHFLRESPEIGFVVMFTIRRKDEFGERYKIDYRFYKGNITDAYANWLENLLEKLQNVFPVPRNDATNARNLLKSKSPHEGNSFWGAFEVKYMKDGREVKISARALLDLLAGKCKQEDFFQLHRFNDPIFGNPFEGSRDSGNLIQEITINKEDDDDDDWITIKLKEADPAISPFKEPPKK